MGRPKLTEATVLERINRFTNGRIVPTGPYRGVKERMDIKCLDCGNQWKVFPTHLLAEVTCGCRVCAFSGMRLAEGEAIKRLEKSSGGSIISDGPYPGATQKKWRVKCLDCGHKWSALVNNLFNGRGCPNHKKLNEKTLCDRLKVNFGGSIFPLEPYPGLTSEKWLVQCRVCNNQWHSTGDVLSSGIGCMQCANDKKRKAQEAAIRELDEVSGGRIIPIGQYKSAKIPWSVKCALCGFCWEQIPNRLFSKGCGCPNCTPNGFQRDKPAIAYYVRFDLVCGTFWKIGITNRTVDQRFVAHRAKPVILDIWSFPIGADAAAFESRILAQYAADLYQGAAVLRDGNAELFTRNVLGIEGSVAQMEIPF
jgi:hypothetical protein